MSSQKLPNRLVFRPDIDPSDDESVRALAKSLTKWALAHQERTQREIAEERTRERARESGSCPPAPPVRMAAQGKPR